MMKYCLLLALLLPQLVELKNFDIKLEPGAVLAERHVPKKPTRYLLTHPSQMRPFIEVTIENVDYSIAYDEKTRKIKYIWTDDKDFRTKDGLKVGEYMELKEDQVAVLPGYLTFAPKTTDGWCGIL